MTNDNKKMRVSGKNGKGLPFVRADYVLVVDDEAGYRDMLCWRLRDEGINVRVARDGEEALTLAADGRVAVVVTDLTMPRLDGLGLLEKLKRTMPQMAIIIVTGYGTVESSVKAMKGGAEDFFLKPLDLEKFVERIKKLLDDMAHPQAQPRRGRTIRRTE